MSEFLKVSGLTQTFLSAGAERTPYRDVSFSLDRGDFLCIIGPSGCGKTTLLRSVAGFVKPTAGEITIDGERVAGPNGHCAMIFQTFDQLFPWRTVLGNVVYPLMVNKKFSDKREARDHARKYLDMVGLSEFESYYPHQLSGGMKQRVAIARAFALEPSLILMDEPFAALDADTRSRLQKELKRIWHESGTTVLFVTHSIIEAVGLSTKVLALGSEEPSVRLFMENPVEGERDKLKTPESRGYSECWTLLSNTVRGRDEEKKEGEEKYE